jgi:NADPH:quinone reductase-like Zn-dependent oxidoreductase
MKSVQFNKYGGPEVLQVVGVDEPHAGPGEVRIAVRAAGSIRQTGNVSPDNTATSRKSHFPPASGLRRQA